MRSFAFLLPVICVVLLPIGASATTVTFAQFNETSAGGNIAHFVKNSNGTETLSIDQLVTFHYMGLNALPVPLKGPLSATLHFSDTTSAAALHLGSFDSLGTFTGMFSFTLLTPYKGFSNLLSGVSNGTDMTALLGSDKSHAATFSFTKVSVSSSFTSAFVQFTPGASQNYSLPFSSVNSSFAVAGGRVNPFTAAATGTFASATPTVRPLPNSVTTPEVSSGSILVIGLLFVLPIIAKRSLVRN